MRVRAVIVHDGKLLVVRHVHSGSYVALPGGHIDFGEDPVSALKRELVEELGVAPQVGPLLYVHSFVAKRDGLAVQSLEFFFLIENAVAYSVPLSEDRSHAHEIAAIEWVTKDASVVLRPKPVWADFVAGTLLVPEVRFITT